MDLLIKHEAFAGRGLAVRTAGFFKGPRLIIDGGEVKGKRLRFSLTDNSGHEREIRLKTNGLDPIPRVQIGAQTDRKSTRLNSSHSQISYAVFCLKTKTPPQGDRRRAARGGLSTAQDDLSSMEF